MQDRLKITNTPGKAEAFAFYIHSASMAAAVPLLNDVSILATHALYRLKDPVVTVLLRDIHEPSPNTSRAATTHDLLVPGIFIQPQARHASDSVDVSTMENIEGEMGLPDGTYRLDNITAG